MSPLQERVNSPVDEPPLSRTFSHCICGGNGWSEFTSYVKYNIAGSESQIEICTDVGHGTVPLENGLTTMVEVLKIVALVQTLNIARLVDNSQKHAIKTGMRDVQWSDEAGCNLDLTV